MFQARQRDPSHYSGLVHPPDLGGVFRARRDLPDELAAWDDLDCFGIRWRHLLRLLVHAVLHHTHADVTAPLTARGPTTLTHTRLLVFLSSGLFLSVFLWASKVAASIVYRHSVHFPYIAQSFFLL